MAKIRFFLAWLVLILMLPLHSCNSSDSKEKEVFKQLPEIQEIKPRKPVKIKLKRNASGSYSWEVSGDDADKIIEADKRLRESVGN